jgi:superfamily II RNA helicase
MFREYPVKLIINQLEAHSLLPAILFRSARKQCDQDLEFLQEAHHLNLPHDHQIAIAEAVSSVIRRYALQEEVIYEHAQYSVLTAAGAGAHHAGQLFPWRILLEELMSQGLLRLLIATGTVAAGVDFPARTAIITSHSKRGSEGFRVLLASELQQMAGRAGRRGKDHVGVCLVAPSLYADARVIHEVAKRPPEPLRSAYFAAPATVLNLLKYRNVDDLSYTVERSLAAFLDRKVGSEMRAESVKLYEESESLPEGERRRKTEKRARRMEREAESIEGRQLALLEQSLQGLRTLGFIQGGSLTPKGVWAAELCTSLVLELAESIDAGLLHKLDPRQLIGFTASISGDPHREYCNLREPPLKAEVFAELGAIVDRVATVYRSPLTEVLRVMPDAAVTVVLWYESDTWSEFVSYIRLCDIALGDVARLITQTADHLHQLTRLKNSHPELAETASYCRGRLLRPPLSDGVMVAV